MVPLKGCLLCVFWGSRETQFSVLIHSFCWFYQVRGCLPSLSGEEGEWVEHQMELVVQALTITEDGEGVRV